MKVSKRVLTIVAIWLCYILQTTVLAQSTVISAVPNLLLIITVSIAFISGKKDGMLTGFLCGLLFDLYYGEVLGVYCLIFMYIGYGCGFFSKVFFDEDLRVPLLLAGASDAALNVIIYIIGFFLRGRLNFGSYLIHVIFPDIAITLVFTVVIYRIMYLVHRSIKKHDMKGRRRTWLKG